MPTLFHLFCALCLTLTPVVASQARAAQSPGSILPMEGPIHDELVNQTMPRSAPYPEEGREGYMGTYTDPATGDSVTTIVSPRAPRQEPQQGPIIVYPQVGTPYGGMVIEQQGHINQGYNGQNHGVQYGRPGVVHGGHGMRPNAPNAHRPAAPHSPATGIGSVPDRFAGYGDARPPRGPSPSLPGNKVQHPGLGMPGGNPGNMGNYHNGHNGHSRPGHAGRP